MLSGMAALNGGLGSTGLSNGSAGPMDALTQAYSGIQQYAAAALPTLYSQSLLQQQSAAGSQKEGRTTLAYTHELTGCILAFRHLHGLSTRLGLFCQFNRKATAFSTSGTKQSQGSHGSLKV